MKMNSTTKIYQLLIALSSVYITGFPSTPEITLNKSSHLQDTMVIKDTLRKLTYEQLEKRYLQNKSDSVLATTYVNYYLEKAKKEQRPFYIAEGYSFKSFIIKKDRKLAVKYMDSAIAVTLSNQDHKYPAEAYSLKAAYLYHDLQRNKALENFLLAIKYAKINNNKYQVIENTYGIGVLKGMSNKNEEALEIFKENLNLLNNLEYEEEYKTLYLYSLSSIADIYNRLGKLDSAEFYTEKGLKLTSKDNSSETYDTFLLGYGINRNLAGDFIKALDTLKKAKVIIEQDTTDRNNAITDLYLGKTYQSLAKTDSAFYYIEKVDKFIDSHNYIPETREAFTMLIEHYKDRNDLENQLRVLQKLIHLDSISNARAKKLEASLIKTYDTEELIRSKNTVIDTINKEKRNSYTFIIALILLLSGAILMVIRYYKRQKDIKQKFEKLEQPNNVEEIAKHIEERQTIDLAPDIVSAIENKLKQFEKDKAFLNSDITLSTLAKNFDSNTAYVSKVINYCKNKNFNHYINDLRIVYAVQRLREDTKFRSYSMNAVAKDSGFNSERSFSRAFTKYTNITPSYFIRKLQNDK